MARWVGLGLAVVSVAACSPGAEPATRAPSPLPVAAAPEAEGPDYLVVAPRAYLAALEPLLAHRRSQGHRVQMLQTQDAHAGYGDGRPDADALRRVIRQIWSDGRGALRFVLLVGDIPRPDEPDDDRIAAFYLPKLEYVESDHRERHLFHRSLLHADQDHHAYPSDHPYAVMEGEPTDADTAVAVGRVPARDPKEARGFVHKLIAYETSRVERPWQRRLVVHAGPARFGDFIDRVIEHSALTLLDSEVPYEFDIDLVFAKPGSIYSARLDRLGESLTERANHGAFVLAYVGHSSPAYFDTVTYRGQHFPIGSRSDFERMRIPSGAPIFVSLSCDVGAFDMSQGRRSIAEEAVLNPMGAIASFAATRESHPYPNLLYGEALIAQLIRSRPRTLGEGISAVRRDMIGRFNLIGERLSRIDTTALKREHVALYNLFGDPATRLRYPDAVGVRLAKGDAYAAGAAIVVELASADLSEARALVTVELRRTDVRGELRPPGQIDQLPLDAALDAMGDNHARVSDKVLARSEHAVHDGRARFEVKAPDRPGDYVIKVFALGDDRTGWGHAPFSVK